MSAQRQSNTGPERLVRTALHTAGLRYRLSNETLPGSPDLANRRARWAVFVHGCYWHQHPGCPRATLPKKNRAFWVAKFRANRERDQRKEAALVALGYRVAVVWECEAGDLRKLDELAKGLSTSRGSQKQR